MPTPTRLYYVGPRFNFSWWESEVVGFSREEDASENSQKIQALCTRTPLPWSTLSPAPKPTPARPRIRPPLYPAPRVAHAPFLRATGPALRGVEAAGDRGQQGEVQEGGPVEGRQGLDSSGEVRLYDSDAPSCVTT